MVGGNANDQCDDDRQGSLFCLLVNFGQKILDEHIIRRFVMGGSKAMAGSDREYSGIFRPPMLLHMRPIPIALSVCLSAALCIVAKRSKIGIWCVHVLNRNVGSTIRLVPFSTPWVNLDPQAGVGVKFVGHKLTLEFRQNGGR